MSAEPPLPHWSSFLDDLRAPDDLIAAARGVPTPREAVARWPRGDWLLFLLAQLAHRDEVVALACLCAESAVHVVPPGDQQAHEALAAARAWLAAARRGAHHEQRMLSDVALELARPEQQRALRALAPATQRATAAAFTAARIPAWGHQQAHEVAILAAEAVALLQPTDGRAEAHLAELAGLLRAQTFRGRPLKAGELARANPAIQVAHDHVLQHVPARPLDATALISAYTLRRQLQASLRWTLSGDDPEPWRIHPLDVDVHTLGVIAQRLATASDPAAQLPTVRRLLAEGRPV